MSTFDTVHMTSYFLFTFCRKLCVSIWYSFREIARYLLKVANFTPPVFGAVIGDNSFR